ncbi:MAG TPA: right-handed parallel beta-helix repeat-containing protein [Verrucomicrobiae bacterium]|nr:right-handed parallel beta-helix repeat-containing protein [Verrucomicrobiae bacterium]
MRRRPPLQIRILCFLCPWVPALAAAGIPEIQGQIDDAIRSHAREVALPPGAVRLEAPLRIRGARDLDVRGDRTTLVLGFTKGTAIQVYDCSNLTFRGFAIDSDPLPFTQGTIISKQAEDRTCEFRVHDGYPSLSEDYLVTHIHAFEAKRVRWKEGAPDIYARRVVALDPRRGRIEFGGRKDDFEALEPGDRIVLNKRDGGGIRFDRCEDVRVEGVTFLAAPGCAVLGRYMRGDNRFSYDVRPGPVPPGATEPRLMSTCADAFNYAYARRGPTLERCHFTFMGDDSVNLHGFTFLVLAVVSPTEFRVGWPFARESAEWVVAPGDPARWLKAGNYAVAGSAPIASFRWEPKPDPKFQGRIEAYWPRSVKGRGAVFALNVAKPLSAVEGDAIDLSASSAPGFTIRDCEFADHRGRGNRIMAADGVIENNLFRRIKQAAISLGPEYVFWREAGWVEDVVVRGNRIEDCGLSPDMWRPSSCTLGAISVFARKEKARAPIPLAADNRGITIEENAINGCALAGIWARCASDLVVRDNRVSRANLHGADGAGADEGFDVRGPIDVRGVAGAEVDAPRR